MVTEGHRWDRTSILVTPGGLMGADGCGRVGGTQGKTRRGTEGQGWSYLCEHGCIWNRKDNQYINKPDEKKEKPINENQTKSVQRLIIIHCNPKRPKVKQQTQKYPQTGNNNRETNMPKQANISTAKMTPNTEKNIQKHTGNKHTSIPYPTTMQTYTHAHYQS